jgi:transposase
LLSRYDDQVELGLKSFPVSRMKKVKRQQKQHEATNLLVRLQFERNYTAIITDWHVPFDNNQAERMVRPIKVKNTN